MVTPLGFGSSSSGNPFDSDSQESSAIRRIKALVAPPPTRKAKNSELNFDYGDIIRAETADGDRVEIRLNKRKGVEFARDLDQPDRYERQRGATNGQVAAFETKNFQYDLQAYDISKTLLLLFKVSKGELSDDEINVQEEYNSLSMSNREQVLEGLGLDPDSSFKVNGVKFKLQGDRFEVQNVSESGADSDIQIRLRALQKRLKSSEPSAGNLNTQVLIERRENLFENYRYAYFDFTTANYEGSDRFADVVRNLTVFPDALFFGLGAAHEMLEEAKVPQGMRNELAPVIANHVSNDVLASMLSIPSSTIGTMEKQVDATIKQYTRDLGLRDSYSTRLKQVTKHAMDNISSLLANLPKDLDPAKLRSALGATYRNGIYSVPRFSVL